MNTWIIVSIIIYTVIAVYMGWAFYTLCDPDKGDWKTKGIVVLIAVFWPLAWLLYFVQNYMNNKRDRK